MQKLVMAGLIGLSLSAPATSAFAAWSSPTPSWFRHSCVSPGARFTNHAFCKEKFPHFKTAENESKSQRANTRYDHALSQKIRPRQNRLIVTDQN